MPRLVRAKKQVAEADALDRGRKAQAGLHSHAIEDPTVTGGDVRRRVAAERLAPTYVLDRDRDPGSVDRRRRRQLTWAPERRRPKLIALGTELEEHRSLDAQKTRQALQGGT